MSHFAPEPVSVAAAPANFSPHALDPRPTPFSPPGAPATYVAAEKHISATPLEAAVLDVASKVGDAAACGRGPGIAPPRPQPAKGGLPLHLDASGCVVETGDIPVIDSFERMGIPDDVLRGVYNYGFEKPSHIQQRAILPIAQGRDLLAQAQSGTGKTGAFTIGLLSVLDFSQHETQAIVLAHTRELAMQTEAVIKAIGERAGVTVHACVSGTDTGTDVLALSRGTQVIVGTPGRLDHMIRKRALRLAGVKIAIIDEADQMLSEGFIEQVGAIVERLPAECRLAMFSATMPPAAVEIARKNLKDPAVILIPPEEVSLEGLAQYKVILEEEAHKLEVIYDLYESLQIVQAIIYCNSKSRVEALAEAMTRHSFTVSYVHGGMTASEREVIMRDFRTGATRVLITTDLLARGIDVQQVSLVINFDLPRDIANYMHRVGRTARFGKKGSAINFVTGRDLSTLKEIQHYYNITIKDLPADLSHV